MHLSSGKRFYMAYRKIRFLAKRGSLFSWSKSKVSRQTAIPASTFRRITLNSSLLFLIAYLIIYTLNLLITGFTALLFDIPVIIYYYDVDYLIRGIDWTHDSVSGVFSSGPLAMFVLSAFLLILYKSVEAESGILRLLVLWMLFHALTRFAGEILVGAVAGKGFGFVILYMFIMDTGKVILTILMLVAMFTAGLFMSRLSLYSANIYFNDLLRIYRNRFIVSQFIIPFLIGNIMIMLIKLPHFNLFDAAVNGSMILFLIAIAVRSMSFEDFYFDDEPRKIDRMTILPLVTILLLLSFRIILGFGIRL